MTPRAFYALLDRQRRAQRHDLFCAAIPACAIYNVHRDKDSDPITPADLIGSEDETPQDPKKQSMDEMKMIVEHLLNPMFGGTDTRGR